MLTHTLTYTHTHTHTHTYAHRFPVKHMAWHLRGDYFSTVAPTGNTQVGAVACLPFLKYPWFVY